MADDERQDAEEPTGDDAQPTDGGELAASGVSPPAPLG